MRTLQARIIAVALLTLLGLAALMISRPHPVQSQRLEGDVLPVRAAPQFTLTDQFGRRISLAGFRGRPVVITFMDAHCTTLCPVVAQTVRHALQELGPEGKRIGVLVISVNPEGDTRAAVTQFSRQQGMLYRWHFLVATRRQLKLVWHAYYIYAPPANAPATVLNGHTSATYLIDAQGRERVLMTSVPGVVSLLRDLRILLGLPSGFAGISSVPAPQVGHPAPAFALQTLSGRRLALHSTRGHAVLLNFWAVWCAPCKSEMPRLAGWYRQMNGKGLIVLGIDQADGAGPVRSFVSRLHTPYPILLDSNGTVSATYDVAGLPTSVLVDRHGLVRMVKEGILDQRDRSAVERIVQGAPDGP